MTIDELYDIVEESYVNDEITYNDAMEIMTEAINRKRVAGNILGAAVVGTGAVNTCADIRYIKGLIKAFHRAKEELNNLKNKKYKSKDDMDRIKSLEGEMKYCKSELRRMGLNTATDVGITGLGALATKRLNDSYKYDK
jgi:hypothetical protein